MLVTRFFSDATLRMLHPALAQIVCVREERAPRATRGCNHATDTLAVDETVPQDMLHNLALHRRRSSAGFSLIECVIALGVVSFAFISLLGMIPVGLNTFHTAIDASVGTQVAQRIIAEARQAKFSELAKLNINGDADPDKPSPDYYFDDQGVPTSSVDHVYEAAVVVHYTSKPPVGTQPPQLECDPAVAPMAVVRVIVRRISAPDRSSEFTAMIANNGL